MQYYNLENLSTSHSQASASGEMFFVGGECRRCTNRVRYTSNRGCIVCVNSVGGVVYKRSRLSSSQFSVFLDDVLNDPQSFLASVVSLRGLPPRPLVQDVMDLIPMKAPKVRKRRIAE